MLFHLINQGLPDRLADLSRRDAQVRHIGHRFAVAVDELVVHRQDFQVVTLCFCDDRGAELDVRRADDKSLCAAGGEIVDGAQGFFAIGGRDLDQLKPILVRRLLGEFPFKLEPRLFRLLDDKADLDLVLAAAGGGTGLSPVLLVTAGQQR